MIEVITPSSNYYDDARQEWNKSIDKYPTAIAYCKTFDDLNLEFVLVVVIMKVSLLMMDYLL